MSEHELVDASPILPSGLCPVRENAGGEQWEEERVRVRVWGVAARRKGRTRARATRLGLRHTMHPRHKRAAVQTASHFAGHIHLLLTHTHTLTHHRSLSQGQASFAESGAIQHSTSHCLLYTESKLKKVEDHHPQMPRLHSPLHLTSPHFGDLLTQPSPATLPLSRT